MLYCIHIVCNNPTVPHQRNPNFIIKIVPRTVCVLTVLSSSKDPFVVVVILLVCITVFPLNLCKSSPNDLYRG